MQTVKKQKLSELAKGKGVYAFLLVGVFVIVTAVLISVNNQSGQQPQQNNLVDLNEDPLDVAQNNEDKSATPNTDEVDSHKGTEEVANNEDLTGRDRPSTLPGGDSISNTNENTEVATNANELSTANTEVANKPVEEEVKPVINTTLESLNFSPDNGLTWPLQGKIIMEYSDNRTVYHQTLQQFKVNPAILIQGEVGSEVLAAAKGIVASVEVKPDTGITLTMDIGNGYKLVYGQLQESNLKAGDVVEEGEVIGKLDKVSKYYSVEGTNLYFQVQNSDSTVNPMSLLKEEE